MKGLDEVYYSLDGIRRRIARLVEMDRLTRSEGMELLPDVLRLRKKVEDMIMSQDNGLDEARPTTAGKVRE